MAFTICLHKGNFVLRFANFRPMKISDCHCMKNNYNQFICRRYSIDFIVASAFHCVAITTQGESFVVLILVTCESIICLNQYTINITTSPY